MAYNCYGSFNVFVYKKYLKFKVNRKQVAPTVVEQWKLVDWSFNEFQK